MNNRKILDLIFYINIPVMLILSIINSNNLTNCIETYNYCVFNCQIDLPFFLFIISTSIFIMGFIDVLFNWRYKAK